MLLYTYAERILHLSDNDFSKACSPVFAFLRVEKMALVFFSATACSARASMMSAVLSPRAATTELCGSTQSVDLLLARGNIALIERAYSHP